MSNGRIVADGTQECQSAGTPPDSSSSHSLKYTAKQYENVPSSLKILSNWLLFRVTWNAATRHYDKTPLKACGRGAAKSNDPATWSDFRAALAALAGKSGHTLGFALPADRSITLIDLDKARDPETGAIADWAAPILARFRGTYIEISVSGEGFHIWLLGTSPDPKGRRKGGVEIYSGGVDAGRMVSVTGEAYDGAPPLLAPLQGALDALYADLFPPTPKAAPETPQRDYAPFSMDDNKLILCARSNPDPLKAARWAALFDGPGKWQGKTQSDDDASHANDLAYYCGPGGETQAAALFRRSALFANWPEKKVKRADELIGRAIALAYRGRTAFYQPREKSIDFETPEPPPENQLNNSGESAAAAADSDELARLQAENARMRQQLAQIRAIVNADGMQVAPLEKVIQIDFIVNAFADEQSRDADGFTVIKIEARRDEETGALKGRPGLADKHGVSRGTVSKALENIEAFGTARFDKTEPQKLRNGDVVVFNRVAPPDRFAPKWERPGGPRKKMGGARPGAGRPRKVGDPCPNTACDGILTERRGIETTEREFTEIVCPNCGEQHGEREYSGKTTTSSRYYAPQENNQLNTDDASADASAWPDPMAAAHQHNTHTRARVDASPHKIENPPPARPCIKCRADDWRTDDDGAHWYCGACPPTDGKQAERRVS